MTEIRGIAIDVAQSAIEKLMGQSLNEKTIGSSVDAALEDRA